MRRRALAPALALVPFALAACSAVQSSTVEVPSPPDGVFTCYLRALAGMGYVVEESDREGGLIRALKEDSGLLSGEYATQATVLVIPSGPEGSDVTVTVRRVRATAGGWSSAGMTLHGAAEDDLERLRGACTLET